MRERSRELRDRIVRVLARLSLVVVLACMAALFVGSAQPTAFASDDAPPAPQQPGAVSAGLLDDANPLGLAFGALVIGGGVVVLLVGAFKPRRHDRGRDLVGLLRD